MLKPSLGSAAVIALSCVMMFGCSKKEKTEDKPVVTASAKPAPPPPPPPPAAPPQADVPFKGTYSKYAETTFKNGRRISTANGAATAVATIQIEPGKVTYAQTYTVRGQKQSVTQVYTFTSADVKPSSGGSYDVAMVFQSITGDTKNYSPDKNRPKIEARKQTAGWEIGLVTTDNNGVMGGVEFR